MKKTLLFITFLVASLMLQAQIKFSSFMPESVLYASSVVPIGEEDFIAINDESYVIFNSSLEVLSKNDFDFPKLTGFVSAYQGADGGVIALFRTYDKKEDAFNYLKLFFNENGEISNKEELTSISEKKKEGNVSRSITSPDGNLHAHFIFTLDKNDKLKELIFFIFDNAGTVLESRSINPSFVNESFSFYKALLANDGTLYFALSSKQSSKKRKDDTNEYIHILKVNEDGETFFNYNDFEFGYMASMHMIQLENNNLFIGGFYSADRKKNVPGRFGIVFDTEREEFLNINTELLRKYDKNTPFQLNMICIHEMENTVVMIGEEKRMIVKYTNQGYYYEWQTKDLVICPFEKNGEMLAEKIIPKHLKSAAQQLFVNAGVIKTGNELHIISNGIYKRHLAGKGEKIAALSTQHPKTGTIVYTVSETGTLESKKVDMPNAEKRGFVRVIYADEHQAFLLFGKGKFIHFDYKLRSVTF
ncbi:MAG: hypothetical protein LBV02_08050 [Bacteroidales bacterium]|jgi:hypothetical protein|nr:hypothetical protein [Bacteroidales bacterium]